MKKLLSLPPNLVRYFHDLTGYDRSEWFCTNDPVGHKLGSGGGSAWLLKAAFEAQGGDCSFEEWLSSETIVAPCGRSEPSSAGLRPIGEDSNADSRFPLGAWPASLSRPAVVANTPLPENHGRGSRQSSDAHCERRRLYSRHATPSTYTRSRCGLLWFVA